MNTIQHTKAQFHSLLLAGALAALTLVATEVQAAGPPSATTSPAYDIITTNATISGLFTANGADTGIYVEFSENGAAFQSFPGATIPASSVDFRVNFTLTPLKPGFPYTYRFRVSNAYGANTSANLQFTTVSTAPTVTTLEAGQITATSALLQAQMQANGEYTAYIFQWGTSTSDADLTNIYNTGILGPYFDSVASLDLSFSPLLQLQPNSDYYYRGIASNSKGSTYGSFVYFHTAGPPAVNTLAAQNIGVSSATLRGTVAPRSLGTEYYFQYGTSTSYGATVGSGSLPAGTGTNSVSFNLTGLTPNQAYHCRLVASNSMGRTYGPNATFTTITVPPTIVTQAPTNVTATTATLRGQVTTGAEGASVWFEIGTTTSYGTRGNPLAVQPNISGTATWPLGLQRGQTYHYRFAGSNAFGTVYGNDVAFTTPTANDHCAEAFPVTSTEFTHTQSTAGMTTGGDVIPPNACPAGYNDVWFKTTLPVGGILTVDTAGSSYDTLLGIYSGACGSLSPIACNDDVNPQRWSSNRVEVLSGDYYFVVSGWLGATGTLNFHLSFLPFAAPDGTGVGVSDIGTRTATLHANVDPGHLPTTTWWVFGPIFGPYSTNPAVLNQSGQPYPVTAPLTDLIPGWDYVYVLVASNSSGVFIGTPQGFSTPADRSLLEATVPGDLIAATSANSPPAQTAPKAIDNDISTKYLNFDKFGTGFTVTPSGNKPVRALTLISADDAPERDPAYFVLEGSLDGTSFTPLAFNVVPPFAGRNVIQTLPLTNTSAFNFYRLTFPTVAYPAFANSMQIAEVELLSDPEFTSPSDTVSAIVSGSMWSTPQKLIDRRLSVNEEKFAVQNNTGNVVVDITPAAGAMVLKGFELIGGNDSGLYAERHPTNLTVFGSQDGTNFVQLGAFTPARPTANMQIEEFLLASNTTAYARYRFNFGAQTSGIWWQLGELRLFGESAPVPPTLAIRASGNSVLVSWPNTPGFQLETRSALLNGPSWTAVGAAPVLSNGVNTVTIPMGAPAGFFRLRK